MFKPVGSKGKKNDMTQKMFKGRYVGHHSRHGSVLVITNAGVAVASSYHRLPDSERWTTDGWKQLKGFPWDVRPLHRELKLPVDNSANATVEAPSAPAVPVLPVTQAPETLGRSFYVLRADVEKHGKTNGCPGCNSDIPGMALQAHIPMCRERIFNELLRAGSKRATRHRSAPTAVPATPAAQATEETTARPTPKRGADVDVDDLRTEEAPEESRVRNFQEGGSSSSGSGSARPAAARTKRTAEQDTEALEREVNPTEAEAAQDAATGPQDVDDMVDAALAADANTQAGGMEISSLDDVKMDEFNQDYPSSNGRSFGHGQVCSRAGRHRPSGSRRHSKQAIVNVRSRRDGSIQPQALHSTCGKLRS